MTGTTICCACGTPTPDGEWCGCRFDKQPTSHIPDRATVEAIIHNVIDAAYHAGFREGYDDESHIEDAALAASRAALLAAIFGEVAS